MKSRLIVTFAVMFLMWASSQFVFGQSAKIMTDGTNAGMNLQNELNQLATKKGVDIWVIFVQNLGSKDIATCTREIRNSNSCPKPQNVVIVGISWQPNKKIFVDYFQNGTPDALKATEINDAIKEKLKSANPGSLEELPPHVLSVLNTLLPDVQVVVDNSNNNGGNIKKDETYTPPVVVKESTPINWTPWIVAIIVILLLIGAVVAIMFYIRKKKEYDSNLSELINEGDQRFAEVVETGKKTTQYLEFEVTPVLGTISTSEIELDTLTIQNILGQYDEYLKDVWKTGYKFELFDENLGLGSLQTKIKGMEADLEAINAVYEKNSSFLQSFQKLAEQAKSLKQLRSSLPSVKAQIEGFHAEIKNFPIVYITFEQIVLNAEKLIADVLDFVKGNNSVQKEADAMATAIQKITEQTNAFTRMLQTLEQEKERLVKAKEGLTEQKATATQLAKEIAEWKKSFSYMPGLSEEEAVIVNLNTHLAKLEAEMPKDWYGKTGIQETVSQIISVSKNMLKKFADFKKAKEEHAGKLQTTASNDNAIKSWKQKYPQLPSLSTMEGTIAGAKANLQSVTKGTDKEDWFSLQKQADAIIAAQKLLIDSFQNFQRAENDHNQNVSKIQSNNTEIQRLEGTVGKHGQSPVGSFSGNDYFALLKASINVIAAQNSYIEILNKQLTAKNACGQLKQQIQQRQNVATQLQNSEFLFKQITGLRVTIPVQSGNDFIAYERILKNTLSNLNDAIEDAENEISRQQQAKQRFLQHQANYGSLYGKYTGYRNHTYSTGFSFNTFAFNVIAVDWVTREQEANTIIVNLESEIQSVETHIETQEYNANQETSGITSSFETNTNTTEEPYNATQETSGTTSSFDDNNGGNDNGGGGNNDDF